MPRLIPLRASALLCAAALLGAAACRQEPQEEGGLPPAEIDTTNKAWEDGVPARDLEEKASPLTPEEAQQRGYIDTTTHLENLGDSDSVDAANAAGPPVPQPDTTPRGDARRDTLRTLPTRPEARPGQGGVRP